MLNVMKADIRSTKLWEYLILLPAVFVLASLANPGFLHPYYLWISYLTMGLCSSSIDQNKQDKVQPVIVSLSITRKEYIGAKYLLTIVWFFFSTIVSTLVALIIDPKMNFFTFELWITSLLLILFFIAVFLPFGLFYKPAGTILLVALIIFIITARETLELPEVHFHPIFLLSIVFFSLSCYLSMVIFEKKNIS